MTHIHSLYKELTGAVDGINKTFVLPSTPVAGSVRFFVRGIEQFYTTDFTVSGTTLTTVEAPRTGDTIYAHYEET